MLLKLGKDKVECSPVYSRMYQIMDYGLNGLMDLDKHLPNSAISKKKKEA
jgi:hypothetical protein